MKVCRKCSSPNISPAHLRNCDYICDVCSVKLVGDWKKANPGRVRANVNKHVGSSLRVARLLRSNRGLSREESEQWAAILMNPGSRCAICGLPNYLIKVYCERGWPFFLGKRFGRGSHPRLTLDHIVPADNSGGFRPLCFACNSMRGAAQFSDEEVLTEVRSKWQWFTAPRFLYWLNSTPGVGGRLHRSVRCQKRDAEYADGASPQPEPPMTPPSTT